jgi:hypothetical protein
MPEKKFVREPMFPKFDSDVSSVVTLTRLGLVEAHER